MFIGRESELALLNNLYTSDKFEFVVMYGRRRVGKTALISEFIKDKKAIYFMGVESNLKQNLENFSKNIMEFNTGLPTDISFSSFQAGLEYIIKLAENERIILVIDEYPYVAKASESLASTLQMVIDKHKGSSKLMLILCGSSMSYMEDKVLAYKSPLYGRRTAQIKLQPFEFTDVYKYFNKFSDEEVALIYGMVGGTPQYLLQINENITIEENIKCTFLTSSSYLFEEPENLLKQEVREPAIYNAIITAIAGGASRLSEVSGKVGETTSVCTTYIKSLIGLGLVKKELPFGEKVSKKTIYMIDDNLFRFWYRFVPENSSIIMRGAIDVAYKRIEPHIPTYMGKVFEEICKEYLWKLLIKGRSPVQFGELGRWWGNDKKSKSQTEIDIMGEEDKDTAIFAECKWTNEKVDVGVLELLEKRAGMFNYKNTYLYLFAKSGFTKGCIDRAVKAEKVKLISYKDIVKEI